MERALDGDRLVRIGFLDESGRSKDEPTLIVAGVLVNGDRHYRAIEECLADIATRHIPLPHRADFVFHAKDIYQGVGKYFGKFRDEWPQPRRYAILRELAAIPRKFSLPVVFGYFHKPTQGQIVQTVAESKNVPPHRRLFVLDITAHASAFALAEVAIEQQMRNFPRDEICMLIAEDTDQVKPAVKTGHKMLQNPAETARLPPPFPGLVLPTTKIKGVPSFAGKTEVPLLQVADVCAYLICRRFRRETGTQEFFELLSPQLTVKAVEFGEPMGAEKLGGGQRI